jgi:hypothetical protein
MNRLVPMVAGTFVLAGCVAPPHIHTHAVTEYSWGDYEDVIYTSYARTDMPPQKQIEVLEQDYRLARQANRRLPPGWHAYLGYLYAQTGKTNQAVQELLIEKSLFPESRIFVDTLLGALKKR